MSDLPKIANDDVLLWGAAAIGQAINRSPRQAYHLLESGLIPGRKVGAIWTATRRKLLEHLGLPFDTGADHEVSTKSEAAE